jgi:CRP/FNR family transcriptional regulator, nitrogen oxide reductase regulator
VSLWGRKDHRGVKLFPGKETGRARAQHRATVTDNRPSRGQAGDREGWKSLLQDCPLFDGIGPEGLAALLESARHREVQRGSFFFLQGDLPRQVCMLVRGKVRLIRSGPRGGEVILEFIEPGDPFGYVAMWAGTAHRVSAQAAQASQALAWDAAAIARLVTRHPGIALRGLRLMAQHVEGNWDRLQDLSTGRVEWRIARALLRLARLTGRTLDAGSVVTLEVREQDLAELVGSTAFSVSRVLSAWKREEIVDVRRERVLLRKPQRLKEIAQDETEG